MTQLSADKPRVYDLGDKNHVPCAAVAVYEGAAVGDNGSGYGRQLVAGDPFRGFALAAVNNAAGAAGDKVIWVQRRGHIQLAVADVAITDVGKAVFASDSNTFVLTQSTNSRIGRVHRFVSAGVAIVAFDADVAGIGSIVPLTDSSGGTAADTIAAIGGSYSQTEVRNAIASLADRVNALARRVG